MSKDIDTNRSGLNRRKVLQSVGAAGLAMTSFVGTTTAAEMQRSVEAVDGHEKRKIISSIISSKEVKTLRNSLSSEIHPDPQNGKVFRVTETNGEEYRFATVKFSSEKDDSSIFLTWNDKNDSSIPAYTITDYNASESVQTRHSIDSGEVITVSESLSDPSVGQIGQSDDMASIAQTWDPDECYSYLSEECVDVNWSCVAQIGVTYASCAGAVLTGSIFGVFTCISTLGVSLWQIADDENCSLCDSTDVREVTVCGVPSP